MMKYNILPRKYLQNLCYEVLQTKLFVLLQVVFLLNDPGGFASIKTFAPLQSWHHAMIFSLNATARNPNTGDLSSPGRALVLRAIISDCRDPV